APCQELRHAPRSALRRLLALPLLAAGALKLSALDAVIPGLGWMGLPWVRLATAQWELVLGAWLLSGAAARAAWLAALLTFSAFAVVSGHLGWVGVASCGCLGPIPANPWWAFGLDVAALAVLAVSYPSAEESSAGFLRAAGLWAVTVLVGFGLLVGAGSLWFGSFRALQAALRDDAVTTDTPFVDFGEASPGEYLERSVSFTNWTAAPVRLIGGTSDCTCATLADLPLEIAPGGTGTIRDHHDRLQEAAARGVPPRMPRVDVARVSCPRTNRRKIRWRACATRQRCSWPRACSWDRLPRRELRNPGAPSWTSTRRSRRNSPPATRASASARAPVRRAGLATSR
ncbi:MAG: DUF1573 domain-containing protein, partial [Gemmataceae bacterium]|nr:DUF1573 domain-containing protein [Gemmataceae bacterium]